MIIIKNLIKFPFPILCNLLARQFFGGCLVLLLFSGFTGEKPARNTYDTVLLVTPIGAKAIYPGATFDAVEGSAEQLPDMRAVVQLKIEDVLVGKFIEKEPRAEESKIEQAKEAAKEKNFLKILTMDFEAQEEVSTVKKWITVAVKDPTVTFNLTDWQDPQEERFKLYLQKVPDQKDTFILVKALKK